MARKHVTNEEFLSGLTTLLSSTHAKSHGSIYLTQKKLPSDPKQIIIRASNGANKEKRAEDSKSKVKHSTVVPVAELGDFYAKYADVCKKGMEGLRKRDKKKKKKKTGGDKGPKK